MTPRMCEFLFKSQATGCQEEEEEEEEEEQKAYPMSMVQESLIAETFR